MKRYCVPYIDFCARNSFETILKLYLKYENAMVIHFSIEYHQWSRISNAFDKSMYIVTGSCFSSSAKILLSANSIFASFVEWLSLKPYCPSWNKLFFMKYSETWLDATFSNNFEIDGSNYVGADFPSVMCHLFWIVEPPEQFWWQIPVKRNWLIIKHKGFDRVGKMINLLTSHHAPPNFLSEVSEEFSPQMPSFLRVIKGSKNSFV